MLKFPFLIFSNFFLQPTKTRMMPEVFSYLLINLLIINLNIQLSKNFNLNQFLDYTPKLKF